MSVAKLKQTPLGLAFGMWMRVLAVMGHSWLIVAIIHVWSVGSAEGVSVLALCIGLTAALNWLTYGALIQDPVLLISGVTSVILNLIMINSVLYLNAQDPTEESETASQRAAADDPVHRCEVCAEKHRRAHNKHAATAVHSAV